MLVGDLFCLLGTQPTKRRFGRKLAPPGNFREFVAHRNRIRVAQQRWVVLPELFGKLAIYSFLGVWGTERNFAAPFGARNGPKTPKSGCFRSSGPFWAKHPPTKFDRMLNADPLNPVWGPTCPWGPRYGRFWGGSGPFRRLGTGFVGWGPN